MNSSKYSYSADFAAKAEAVCIANDNGAKTRYTVFVGTPQNEDGGFIDNAFFSSDDFTNLSDALKARKLAISALAMVDANLAQALTLSDVKDEVTASIERTAAKSRSAKKNKGLLTKQEAIRAVNEVLDYYISFDI